MTFTNMEYFALGAFCIGVMFFCVVKIYNVLKLQLSPKQANINKTTIYQQPMVDNQKTEPSFINAKAEAITQHVATLDTEVIMPPIPIINIDDKIENNSLKNNLIPTVTDSSISFDTANSVILFSANTEQNNFGFFATNPFKNGIELSKLLANGGCSLHVRQIITIIYLMKHSKSFRDSIDNYANEHTVDYLVPWLKTECGS